MKFISIVLLVFISNHCQAQFAPQAGVLGSTAIHKSSPVILSWATQCSVERGYINIENKTLGKTSLGDNTAALGIADGEVISLGDSGVATLQFAQPIYNGEGPDFAVFENGFQNPVNAEEAYLELAFVEVSSDGEHFFRFPATSNTSSVIQIDGVGEYMNARYINNLAGKYIAQYGTPFDLEELKDIVGLNVHHISHVRIIDAIGSIKSNQSFDKNGQKINDPFPTPFASGGFDLDAVGGIHINPSNINTAHKAITNIYPNPSSQKLSVDFPTPFTTISNIKICDISGKELLIQQAEQRNEFDISLLQSGLYFLYISSASTHQCIGKFSKI